MTNHATTNTTVRLAGLVAAAAGMAWGTASAHGQTTWTNGAGNGNWHTPQNWSTNAVPLPSESVYIPSGFPGVSASGAFVQTLTALSPLSVGTAGTTVAVSAFIKDFSTTGGFNCPGSPVTFTGDVQVNTSYFWIATSGFTSSGMFNVTNMPLTQTTFTNTGTLKVDNGTLTVGGASTTLMNSGTLELRSNGHLKSSGKVKNTGTWRKVGAGDAEVQCNVDHTSGTLDVQEGLLRLTGGGFYNAPMTIETGGRIRLEGPFVALGHNFDTGAGITGGGELEVQGAGSGAVQVLEDLTVNLTGDDGLHMQSGGVMIWEGHSLINTGKLRWEGGAFEGPGQLANGGGGTLLIPAGKSVPANDAVVIFNGAKADIDGVLNLNDGSTYYNGGSTFLRGELRASTPTAGTVRSYGQIRADPGPGKTAKIQPRLEQSGGTTNVLTGTLSLQGGGALGPATAILQAFDAGTVLAFDFGTYEVVGKNVQIIALSASAEARIRGAGTVVSVQAGSALTLDGGAGDIFLELNAKLGGPGTIKNIGEFIWNSQIGVNGQANFSNNASGDVLIPVGGAKLRGSFTNDSGAEVLQQGTLDMANSTLTNNGHWVIDPTSPIQIGITGVGGLVVNNSGGIISAEAGPMAGQSAQISTTLDNQGTVQAIGGITLTINGQLVQLQNGVLSGGTWQTAEGGRIVLPGVPPITTIGRARVIGSLQGMPWLAGVKEVKSGYLHAQDDIVFTSPFKLSEDQLGPPLPAVVRIGPGATVTVPGSTTVGSPQQTVGSVIEETNVFSLLPDPPMLITPVLTMHGVMRPGGADAPGPFNLTGQLSMQTSGVVEVELGGLAPETEHDAVTITGGAALGGTLDLSLVNGFVPALGQSFAVLTATGEVTGTFAAVNQPAAPPMPTGLKLVPVYTENGVSVRVEATCYPDCNADAALTVADFGCFQTKFVIGDPYADCSGDGNLTVADFGCFQTRFVVGCP
ncbi:MAG: hypothetical protein ACKVU4_15835 [Phycisphaerales bacterium]